MTVYSVCFIISTISLLIVSITMFARANDLRLRPGIKWCVRLLGFILAGTAPIGVIGYAWAQQWMVVFIYMTFFLFGIMLVFLTTPYLPPWWNWISGKDAHPDRRLHHE